MVRITASHRATAVGFGCSAELPGGIAVGDTEQAVRIREDGQVFPEALQSHEPEPPVARKEGKIDNPRGSMVETPDTEEAGGVLLLTAQLRPFFHLCFSSYGAHTVPWEEVKEMTSLGMRHQSQMRLQEKEGGRYQKLSPEETGAHLPACLAASGGLLLAKSSDRVLQRGCQSLFVSWTMTPAAHPCGHH